MTTQSRKTSSRKGERENAVRYIRQSDFSRDAGRGKREARSTERQDADTAAHCKAEGYNVLATFVDIESASKIEVEREGYQEMLALILDRKDHPEGAVHVVVVQHDDRIFRSNADQVPFLALTGPAGLRRIEYIEAQDVIVGDEGSEAFAEIRGAINRQGSRATARRVRTWHRHRADAGLPPTTETYGYAKARTADGTPTLEFDPIEAPIVREMVERLLAGESSRAIAAELAARGVRTRQYVSRKGREIGGAPFLAANIVTLLIRPTLAGLRDFEGQIIKGNWPALVTTEEHERLKARAKANVLRHSTASKHPLSGIIRCGRCGGRMYRHLGAGRDFYRCEAAGGRSTCGAVTIRGHLVETAVLDAIVAEIDSADFAARVQQAMSTDATDRVAQAAAQLVADRARLGELADAMADDPDPDFAIYRRSIERVRERITANEAVVASAPRSSARAAAYAGQGAEIRKDWAVGTFAHKRALVETLVASITVQPASTSIRRIQIETRFPHAS